MTPTLVYLLVCALPTPTGDPTILNKHVIGPKAQRVLLACDTDGECESAFYSACRKLHPETRNLDGWLETYPADRSAK